MVGQEHVLRALVNALDQDRLHHAYLFTGTRGVGKTTIARILAKCLNCEAGVSSQPCGECSSCVEIAEGRSVDLLEVDAASRTKVEDTRELLDNVQYAPTRSRFKVYLIDEVHMLSSHSFNALLKTLEEPPPHVKFLLATTDPQKLPATILSRCLQFNLKNMPAEQVVGHLQHVLHEEGVAFEDPALWLLGRAAAGSMRDALSLTDQAIAFGSGAIGEEEVRSMLGSVDLSFVYQVLAAVGAGDPAELLATIGRMAEHAPDFEGSLDELISLVHRVALAQVVPDAVDNSWGDAERVLEIARTLSAEDVQLFYQIALNGKRDIGLASDPRSGFEMIVLRMIAFRPLAVIDPALRPEDLQQQVAPTPAKTVVGEVDHPGKKPHEAVAEPPERAEGIGADAAGPVSSAGPPPADVAGLTADDWPQLLDALSLSGALGNVAANCELRSCGENALKFVLDRDNAGLFNPNHQDSLRVALENHFDAALSVSIMVGALESQTPAMLKAQQVLARQAAAEAEIEDDPDLKRLIERFDGELDRSSIVPLDYQES
jgi:DNA polymerase-3 subunit gamma/tau